MHIGTSGQQGEFILIGPDGRVEHPWPDHGSRIRDLWSASYRGAVPRLGRGDPCAPSDRRKRARLAVPGAWRGLLLDLWG